MRVGTDASLITETDEYCDLNLQDKLLKNDKRTFIILVT